MPPKNKPTGRQIPVAPVDSVRMGKGPWRVKSKSLPGVESAGPVRESNSFAALQCPEADALLDPADGVMKWDALGFSEPDLSSSLNGEEADLRILTPSELEWENRGAPPLENEGPFQVGSSRSLSGCKGDLPSLEEEQTEEAPPTSSNMCNPSGSRSSRLQAKRIPTALCEVGSSFQSVGPPPDPAELGGEIPVGCWFGVFVSHVVAEITFALLEPYLCGYCIRLLGVGCLELGAIMDRELPPCPWNSPCVTADLMPSGKSFVNAANGVGLLKP
ncbi:hypothetical protein Nepgr_032282 [Nepenthes gracilis]|uniref:Uncharacterized protein n=1 Tax=Nepenthes gracilis TaxID=150966 RepID=A0AAD3TJT6_NEPGR|nr:hypothetical protein Nepgr_032282 [Nepenthes gracilis]